MARNGKGKVEDRIERLLPSNKHWYQEYEKYLSISASEGTVKVYRSKVLNFLEDKNAIDVADMEFEHVGDYILSISRASTANATGYALKSFFSYISTNTSLKFDPDEINDLTYTNEEVEEEAESSKPLAIRDVIQLRKILLAKKEYRLLISFELCYRYGLELDNLEKCYLSNYDFENQQIKDLNLFIEDDVHQLIISDPDGFKKLTRGSFSNYFNKIGEYIGRSFKWQDIDSTRKQNFFKCPVCYEYAENTVENWVLIQYVEDDRKWIVCKECGENGEQHG